jgi:choline dehydrogenase
MGTSLKRYELGRLWKTCGNLCKSGFGTDHCLGNKSGTVVFFLPRTHVVTTDSRKLSSEFKSHYDFIVCGSGSSGSVVARRLAESPEVSVLLLEAGGADDVPSVMNASEWWLNLGSDRDWKHHDTPNPALNGRAIPLSTGKVLGGGSSINAMYWVRGHKNDWDFFASEAGDSAWNYESAKQIYRRIEDWQGEPDAEYRGAGGPVYVRPTEIKPVGSAMFEAMQSVGIPVFASLNGSLTECDGGGSRAELTNRDGRRQSIFRSYIWPFMDRPNLTVLPHALVTHLLFEGRRATGVEVAFAGRLHRLTAGCEVVLSLGAIHTPKLLLQSGIGDKAELKRIGITVVQHLPGVGQNFQDHLLLNACLWEYPEPQQGVPDTQVSLFWKSNPMLDTPDLQLVQREGTAVAPELAGFHAPRDGWRIFPALVRPQSRGFLRLTGPNPADPIAIQSNALQHPDDMKAMQACVELCRGLGNSSAMRPFVKREVIPGPIKGLELDQFIRNTVGTFWHHTCTAKMGRDAMSVVDAQLKVYGLDRLRIADGSILPRVPTGNTMAPCTVIGERAAEILRKAYKL